MESVLRLFSVKDVTAGRFGPMFESVNTDVAIRNFRTILLKIDQPFRDEYELYFIGSYDQVSGEILQEGPPVKVVIPEKKIDKLEVVK